VYEIIFYLALSLALAMVSSYLHMSGVICIDVVAFKGVFALIWLLLNGVFGLGTIGDGMVLSLLLGVESSLNSLLLPIFNIPCCLLGLFRCKTSCNNTCSMFDPFCFSLR